jgi:hypothetical protein
MSSHRPSGRLPAPVGARQPSRGEHYVRLARRGAPFRGFSSDSWSWELPLSDVTYLAFLFIAEAEVESALPSSRGPSHPDDGPPHLIPRQIRCWLRPWDASFRPAQRPRENLGNKGPTGPAATSRRTGHLFAYLALSFMTPDCLHDRSACRRDGEPYGFSFCLRTSVGLRSIVGTTERLMAKDGSRDRVNPRSSRANEMSLPPGKRG